MRFNILFVCLFGTLSVLAADPEVILPKTKVIKSISWYADQALHWKEKSSSDKRNPTAWLNYYTASRYAHAAPAVLEVLVNEMGEAVPNSFELNLVKGLQLQYSEEAFALFKHAYTLNAHHAASYAPLMLCYELHHDADNRKQFGKKLLEADMISSSLLNYSYNVLMSLEPGAILITEGENTTIPLFVLQDVMNIRADVTVLSMDLLSDKSYRQRKLADNKLSFADTPHDLNSFAIRLTANLPVENPDSKFYYALTLGGENIVSIKDHLYVVGLASQFSTKRVDNISAIRENLEKKFLLDYLTVDFNGENEFAAGKVLGANYLVPMLMLHDHYRATNAYEQASDLEKLIIKIATETGKDFLVKNFLNRAGQDVVPFFPMKLNAKATEGKFRKISPTIYGHEHEVTNGEYNAFLSYLTENNLTQQYEQFKFDLSSYDEPALSFMKGYTKAFIPTKKQKFHTNHPAVSISFEGAQAYCEWLTEQYNNAAERKFKKVKFRLPSIKEWQVAALGNPTFTTWELDDNIVEVSVPKNDTDELSKDFKNIPVRGNDILYPWYKAYNYRNKVLNSRGCALGNFKFPESVKPCIPSKMQVPDGFTMMAPVESYFPNNVGLYDAVGNVAEMIDEKGKACGGSWNHAPEESTIRSINTYTAPDATIGFRVFMEIIEQ